MFSTDSSIAIFVDAFTDSSVATAPPPNTKFAEESDGGVCQRHPHGYNK